MIHIQKVTHASLREAAHRLADGEIIVYGCASNYIMCTNMQAESSVKRMFELKGRDYRQPLPIILDPGDAHCYASMTAWQQEVITQLMPGPISFIVPARNIPPYVNGGLATVSLVWQENWMMRRLYELFGIHTGTSANLHGQPPPTRVEEAVAYFGDAISMYLDSGPTRYGIPNTVIDLTKTPIVMLREGPVSLSQVLKLIAERVKLPATA